MRRGMIALAAAFAILALVAIGWGVEQKNQREQAELQLGADSARLLSMEFAKANQLKVASISGALVTKAQDRGTFRLLDTTQTVKAPYAVDYFIDLSQVTPRNFSWSAERKTLLIEIPDVVPAKANVDEAAGSVEQSGLFISRGAAVRMQKTASRSLAAGAEKAARRPENLQKAREAARAAVQRNALAPLRAAGIGDVTVEVRFGFERNTNDDVWDYTIPYEQVAERLEQMKQRRGIFAGSQKEQQ